MYRTTTCVGNIYRDTANVNMAKDSVNITVGNTGANTPVSNKEPFYRLIILLLFYCILDTSHINLTKL